MTNLEFTKDYGVIHLVQLLVVEEFGVVGDDVEVAGGVAGEVVVQVQLELDHLGQVPRFILSEFRHLGQRF